MNDATANDATDWPITLDNEYTPEDAVFDAATTTATSASTTASAADASNISPAAHFLSSGLKLDTELFLK